MLDRTASFPPEAPVETRFLPALATAVSEWFPGLDGRAIAVSNIEITKENVPTLPLVLVAFARSESTQPARNHPSEFTVADFVVVDFWLEPDRIRRTDGSATPYWNYYDYEWIRDRLLTGLADWHGPGPRQERLAYRSLGIAADPFAVTLTFTFEVRFQWCPTTARQGDPFTAGFRLCTPSSCLPDSFYDQSVNGVGSGP